MKIKFEIELSSVFIQKLSRNSYDSNNVHAGWWTSLTTAVNQNICRCCFHDRVKQACPKVASSVVVMKERKKEKDTWKQLQEERKLRDNCYETRKRRSRADISFHRGVIWATGCRAQLFQYPSGRYTKMHIDWHVRIYTYNIWN